MGRASQAQAGEHREQLVAAASRLFREQDFQVSLTELTGAVGLTTGVYRQFKSKDALPGEATEYTFTELRALMDGFEAAHTGDDGRGTDRFDDYYLPPGHAGRSACSRAGDPWFGRLQAGPDIRPEGARPGRRLSLFPAGRLTRLPEYRRVAD